MLIIANLYAKDVFEATWNHILAAYIFAINYQYFCRSIKIFCFLAADFHHEAKAASFSIESKPWTLGKDTSF